MAEAVSFAWFDDLDAVAADAGGALDRAAQPLLYDRLDWFRLTVAHRLAGPPLVLRARRGESAAWLFLTRKGEPLASWYTLRFGVVRGGAEDPALVTALFTQAGRRLPRLTLRPVADADLAPLRSALRAAGWVAFARPEPGNRTLDCDHRDFAHYWASRPAPLRNTVARRTRSHPLAIRIHTRFDPTAWADYQTIYRASWKPAEGSFPFLRALAEQEGAAGTLRLGIAHDPAGHAVAAQLWLTENGTATIHKLAHREDARAGSPGSLLSHAMFRHAFEVDRVDRIDFGLGDETYKRDWVDRRSSVWRIDAFRPATARGLAGIAREVAGRLARRGRSD